jgi:hypothetical protein
MAGVPLASLSALLDAIQGSRTAWRRMGPESPLGEAWAALVAAEVAAQPEERREALAEARTAPPIGPEERFLTYAEWCRERAAELQQEGLRGNGQGEGWWPARSSKSHERP